MNSRVQDSVLGTVLLVIAGVWTGLVLKTIPPGFGDGEIGPRAFPLVFGLALLILAALLLAWPVLTKNKKTTKHLVSSKASSAEPHLHWLPALTVLVEIMLYGFLLEKAGFLLATPIIVLIVMLVNLRTYSITKLLGFALGLTVGCWLVFEKIMGIYLAKGTWLNLG